MGRWLRHRPGGVGLRSEHPGITRAKGPSTSWDSWPTRSRKGPWGRRSVHRSAKTASRGRFGAFVYTVATLWTDVGMQECTQIGENGLSESFLGICVHCCTHELCRVARAPQPPWCVGDAPSVATSPLVGKTGSARAPPPLGWRLRRGSNPHKPPRNHLSVIFGPLRPPRTSPGPSRGPSGCPRRRRLTGPASTSARCIPGSVSAGQGCLPRLPAPVPGGSTRASRSAQGTTGPVWSRRPAHLVRLALPSHPARARLVCLPSARPSRPFHHGAETVLQLRVCHILPCFTPVRARGRRCACPGPHAREATPTHPSA